VLQPVVPSVYNSAHTHTYTDTHTHQHQSRVQIPCGQREMQRRVPAAHGSRVHGCAPVQQGRAHLALPGLRGPVQEAPATPSEGRPTGAEAEVEVRDRDRGRDRDTTSAT
jgi:hypothetical protein